MSYILDALKKADAERERRGVPGLHAQTVAPGEEPAPAGSSRLGLAAAALTLLVGGALAVWWLLRGDASAPAPVVTAAAPTPPLSLPPVAAPTPAPQIVVPSAPAPAPATVIVPPAPPKPPPAPAADAPLPSYAELPPDVKSRLPALTVGGSVYSPNAAARMVIVNGQVLREGDQPLEGLMVERIGMKSTVLSFRGTRFELKH